MRMACSGLAHQAEEAGCAPVRHMRSLLHERTDDIAQLQQGAVDVLSLGQGQA